MNKKISILILSIYLINITTVSAKINVNQIKSEPFSGTVMPVEIKLPNYYDSLNGDKKAKRIFVTSYMGKYFKTGIEYIGTHPGVDIILPMNTPIRSIANGVVVNFSNNRWSSGAGRFVIIRHDNVTYKNNLGQITYTNLYSGYEHLNFVYVTLGQKIKKGEVIGLSGNTGNSTMPHLHIQVDLPSAPYHPLYSRSIETNKNHTIHPIKWIYDFLDEKDIPPLNIPVIANETKPSSTNKTIKENKEIIKIPKIEMDDMFLDLATNHTNYKAIKELAEKGIIRGEEDGKFYPDKTITRLEFWNFITDISGYEEPIKISRPFDNITRAESIKLAYLAWNIPIEDHTIIASIFDIYENDWYFDIIIDALNKGYIEAKDGQFFPNKLLTKACLAQILYNLGKF